MLSSYQTELIALLDTNSGEIICMECAENEYGVIFTARASQGLYDKLDLQPMIRYEMDTFYGEILWDDAEQFARDLVFVHESALELAKEREGDISWDNTIAFVLQDMLKDAGVDENLALNFEGSVNDVEEWLAQQIFDSRSEDGYPCDQCGCEIR